MPETYSASKPWKAAGKAAVWLLNLLQTDGRFAGGTDLRAYYKTPAALLAHGYVNEAHLVLDYVESKLLLPDGDLAGEGVPWFGIYRTYPHSWLCYAAVTAGRYDLARQLSTFISTYHNGKSGGFFADHVRSVEEIMTTSMAGLACLSSGHHDLALASAHWLDHLWGAQPNVKLGLYTAWRDGLVLKYPEGEAASYLVDAAKKRQYYFQYGIAAALLSAVAGVTGDRHWLNLASELLAATEHLAEDRYQTPQSGKVGWGAAWTYRLTRDAGQRQLVEAVTAGLSALQNDDGSWLATGVYGGAGAEADSVTIDVTSEFLALLSYMAQIPE